MKRSRIFVKLYDIKKRFLSGNKKNIAKISAGTLMGQGITIVTLPIISRIYGAEIIGVWSLLNAIAIVIMSFSDLGLTNAIMVEDEDKNEQTYKVVTTVVAFISIISSLVITLYYSIFAKFNYINVGFMFVYLVVIVFTTQQIQVCYTWLNRKKEYNTLMKNPLIKNGIYGLFAILLGLIGMETYGYFIGYGIGQIATLIHMKRKLPRKMFTLKKLDYNECVKNNIVFLKYQMPTNIISNIKNQLPVILINGFWGKEILGYYSITVRLLQIPTQLLANAIGRVFFQTVSNMKREGKNIGIYVLNNLTNGMKIAIIPITLLMAFGDILAIIFLGSDWLIAGNFIRILSAQYFFMFLLTTVQGLATTLRKQKYSMFQNAFQIFAYIISVYAGRYLFDSIYITLGMMSVLFIFINIVYFIYLFKVMNIRTIKYIKVVIPSLVIIILSSTLIRILFEKAGLLDLLKKLSFNFI